MTLLTGRPRPHSEYIKGFAGTEYHTIGSCAMLPKSLGGVVSPNLVVYGTKNIRVVDVRDLVSPIRRSLTRNFVAVHPPGSDQRPPTIHRLRNVSALTSSFRPL